MNGWLLAAGALTLLGFIAHVWGGGREIAAPMLKADFDLTARRVLWVCWHAISVELLLGGLVLVIAGLSVTTETTTALVRAVATIHVFEAALFIAIIAISRRDIRRAWLAMPQWILFILTGGFAWIGSFGSVGTVAVA